MMVVVTSLPPTLKRKAELFHFFIYKEVTKVLQEMANSLCFTPVCSLQSPNKPGTAIGNSVPREFIRLNEVFHSSGTAKIGSLEVKATNNDQSVKPRSILCADCDGNGAKQCSQCKGTGVNSVDHFNGQFKAGASCWLCRGKREILCGNCNGAGFIGGFMSTIDE